MHTNNITNIRHEFASLLQSKKFTSVNREATMTGLTGNTTIEIIGASFIADEEAIFGEVNWDYVKREEEWYNSMSLNVNDIPGGAPAIWKAVADKDGFINSNYGWCIYSNENFSKMEIDAHGIVPEKDVQRDETDQYYVAASQYDAVAYELKKNPLSRRAVMIYTRPSMWLDYNKNGRSDFICTNSVGYVIRNGALNAHVQMRSNDSIFGFRNDLAWQRHVLEKLAAELDVEVGQIHWSVTSLHVYARHYYLVDHFIKTGKNSISQKDYAALYPNSPYLPQ
jgi:thymidylate synthase